MDAAASELRGMNAAYERCVKKAVIAMFIKSRLKNDRASLFAYFILLVRKTRVADKAKKL